MLRSFLNFLSIPRIRSPLRIRGIGGKLRKLRNISKSAEIFKSWRFVICLYQSLRGFALKRQITNNECLKGNATRISQYLPILVSCCCLSSKKLSDWTFSWSFKFSSFLIQVPFFKNFRTFPMICKLSPVEVSPFQRKKRPPNRKRLLFGVRVAKGKKVFLTTFWYWRYRIHGEIQISPNFYQQCIFKFSQNQNQELRTGLFCTFSRYLKGIINGKSFA